MRTLKVNGKTTHHAQMQLRDFVVGEKFTNVITNLQLGVAFKDTFLSGEDLVIKPEINDESKKFQIGQIGELSIFVDPLMRWDDTRLICDNEEILIEVDNILI